MSNTIATMRWAASGCASALARSPMAARAVRSESRATTSCSSLSSVIRACGISTAALAEASTSAFLVWWSSAASGNGTSSDGLPAAASSATVLAPLRARIRSAAAKRAPMSSRNALTCQRDVSAPLAAYAASTASAVRAPAWCRMVRPGTCSRRRTRMRGMASLSARAPWLPPKTSKWGAAVITRGGSAKNSGRTGMPVTCALRKCAAAGGKLTAAALTRLPMMRFARPGAALGSKASVGMPLRMAAIIAGPEA